MANKEYRYPPGPSSGLDPDQIHKGTWDHKEKYGPLSSFVLGGNRLVMVNEVEALRETLDNFELGECILDRPNTFMKPFFMKGGMSYSENWRQLREICHKSFDRTAEFNNGLEGLIYQEVSLMKDTFRKANGEPMDPTIPVFHFDNNLLAISSIGERFDYDHEFQVHLRKYYESASINLFKPTTLGVLTKLPWLRFIPFCYGKIYQDVVRATDRILPYLFYNIKEKSESELNARQGFVCDLLRAQRSNEPVTDENIISVIHEMHMVSMVSMNSSFMCLLYVLMFHPHAQKKIFEEVESVIGKDREPKPADQENMPYTQAAILEGLRLVTVAAASVPHCASQDVSYKEFHFEKGTTFLSNLWKIHHDEELWDEPWAFKPERLLDGGLLVAPDHPNRRNICSFGSGGRRCVGEALSLSTIFVTISSICRSFELRKDETEGDSTFDAQKFEKRPLIFPPIYKARFVPRV